ncbi:helix-turn-helix transcriptional regulator [Streptomyces sp. NPDC048442]|uniref:helix-turn-helix transcriptional regulator n=1 Tax=Streptomyces sp. NPDC048442 TaxID=3154823 RepID=UPI00341A3E79
MTTNEANSTHPHAITEMCEASKEVYASALRSGRIPRDDVAAAPCLMDFALLHPDPDDAFWLRPVPPAAALAKRLHTIENDIQVNRRLSVQLSDAFEPFMAISAQSPAPTYAITVLEGTNRINSAIDLALADTKFEVLTIQPGGGRSENDLKAAVPRGKALNGRGGSIRTLYQHTVRHSQGTLAYAEMMADGQVEIRTLEELVDRMLIFDRKVAFVPAQDDRQIALELRHPGLVEYLANVFEHFWRRATPLIEPVAYDPTPEGISGVQRSIAKLLVEGYVDEAIARRLGMNVRTCRAHIAKLAAALGSGSRAQLGFLIARSNILDN